MATAFERVGGDRSVVVARINGELRDLATEVTDTDVVEPVSVDTPEGLAVLRHSAAHVLAQAVQDTFPDARLGIGPPIKDGFYYDFDVAQPFTPDDLDTLEKRMVAILKSGQRFARRVVTEGEAVRELAHEPFKLRLIGSEGGAEVMEVGGAELTIYDNLDAKTGERCWGDLCRGPHVPDTRYIPPNAVKLMRTAAAYWLGDQATALGAVTAVAVWKEAGFFMIFYLAALQSLNPSLREAAAIEGASRWTFFWRVQWPLLMPTTLFVLVNAIINAVRMVDHVVVLTRGGPDNASTLLLFHLYEVGFKFWDTGYAAALTMVLLALLAATALFQFFFLDRRVHYK